MACRLASLFFSLLMLAATTVFGADEIVTVNIVRPGEPAFDEARHLLYQVYVEEEGWNPKNDRTGIRVEQGKFGPMLVNDYDYAPDCFRVVVYVVCRRETLHITCRKSRATRLRPAGYAGQAPFTTPDSWPALSALDYGL